MRQEGGFNEGISFRGNQSTSQHTNKEFKWGIFYYYEKDRLALNLINFSSAWLQFNLSKLDKYIIETGISNSPMSANNLQSLLIGK